MNRQTHQTRENKERQPNSAALQGLHPAGERALSPHSFSVRVFRGFAVSLTDGRWLGFLK